jgi:hypothetical protein
MPIGSLWLKWLLLQIKNKKVGRTALVVYRNVGTQTLNRWPYGTFKLTLVVDVDLNSHPEKINTQIADSNIP